MRKVAIVILVMCACVGSAGSVRATGPNCRPSPFCHPPVCGKTCSLQARSVEEQRPCYRIECQEICIPAVTLPWQKCDGPPKCGKVIRVNVLRQDTQSRKKCEYTWPIRSSCAPCASGGTSPDTLPTR